ncbi:hypothetical protein OAX78_00265 [Planctomycetota bacterium]|nr:hypothetical protein [Planctomycetota bacterium]
MLLAMAHVEVPTRHPLVVEAAVGAAAGCGLTVAAMSMPEARQAAALVGGALTQGRVEWSVLSERAGALELDELAQAHADPKAGGVLLSGDAPRWLVWLPARPGPLVGLFPAQLSVAEPEVVQFFAALFDLSLVEWGVVDVAATLGPRLVNSRAPANSTDPNPLPCAGRLTYLSPDMAHQVGDSGSLGPGLKAMRSPLGGSVFAFEDGKPETLEALTQALAVACQAGRRPPIEVYPVAETAVVLRDVSPGLAQWQRRSAQRALRQLGEGAGFGVDLRSLESLERALLGRGIEPPSFEVCADWSALAGEVLVSAGARWRRRLDPWHAFPANVVIQTAGSVLFSPYEELLRQRERGVMGGLSTRLKGLML